VWTSPQLLNESVMSWVESGYLYAAPNSLFSHNGAGRWFTRAGKAESSAGAWRCSAKVRGLVAREVDCSRLRGRTLRSSAGQRKSELWAREGFQSLQSAVDAFPRNGCMLTHILITRVMSEPFLHHTTAVTSKNFLSTIPRSLCKLMPNLH